MSRPETNPGNSRRHFRFDREKKDLFTSILELAADMTCARRAGLIIDKTGFECGYFSPELVVVASRNFEQIDTESAIFKNLYEEANEYRLPFVCDLHSSGLEHFFSSLMVIPFQAVAGPVA